jgi:hypothetical protein
MHQEKTSFLKHIRRGCGNLPICGEHPGTPFLIIMILIGLLTAGFFGALAMSGFFVPIYLVGAYNRSVYDLEHKKNS